MDKHEIADVVFVVGTQRREFPCHRTVFAAQSKVFEAMLYGSMKEAHTKEIPLPTIEPRVFELLQRYMYTGCMDLKPDDVFPVMSAADQYDLPDLKRECGKMAHECINPENVATALHESSMMREHWLINECLKFIDQNASTVVESDAFLDLSEEDVLTIIQRDSVVLDEIDLFRAVIRWGKAQQVNRSHFEPENKIPDLPVILKNVLPHIRLAQISPKDLIRIIKPTNVFPLETLFHVMSYHAAPEDVDHKGVIYQPRQQAFIVLSALRHWSTYGTGVRQFTYSAKSERGTESSVDKSIIYLGKCEDSAGCLYSINDMPAGTYYVWICCIDLPHSFNCRSYGSWDNHSVCWSAESDGTTFSVPTWVKSKPQKLSAGSHTWKFGSKPDGGYFTIGWAQLIFTTNPNFEPSAGLYRPED
jgi:hypothetical protein